MILPLEVVWIYLAIGLGSLVLIFSIRKDMRSILWGVLTHMEGFHPLLGFKLLKAVAILYVLIILWFLWVIVAVMGLMRIYKGKPNIPQEIDEEEIKPAPAKGETVSKEQVQQLRQQIRRVGASDVKGKLFVQLRKKASKFIRDKRKTQKEVTVDEVLVNVDASPEFVKLLNEIGLSRDKLVAMCIELGAVDK